MAILLIQPNPSRCTANLLPNQADSSLKQLRNSDLHSNLRMSFPSNITVSHDIAQRWTISFPETASNIELIAATAVYSEQRMSDPRFDSSHDFNHIRRVVAHAECLLKAHRASQTDSKPLDATLVILGALLHDVFDHKYSTGSDPIDPVMTFLTASGVSRAYSRRVQNIIDNVSYSRELENQTAVQTFLSRTPELGIVQDADRLEALGAMGIARTFTFNGARGMGMTNAVAHLSEKVVKLETMMKTDAGKAMAAGLTSRAKVFLQCWAEEASLGMAGAAEV